MKYAYEITGAAADRQTWFVEGEVEIAAPGEFMGALNTAMRSAFLDLTKGAAVYGQPGKACVGPYAITRLMIREKEDPQCR